MFLAFFLANFSLLGMLLSDLQWYSLNTNEPEDKKPSLFHQTAEYMEG